MMWLISIGILYVIGVLSNFVMYMFLSGIGEGISGAFGYEYPPLSKKEKLLIVLVILSSFASGWVMKYLERCYDE